MQWTAYMIFMVLVGGIGTFEGAILGAVIFFLIETWFGATGVWYLVGLGAAALVFALAAAARHLGRDREPHRAAAAAGRLSARLLKLLRGESHDAAGQDHRRHRRRLGHRRAHGGTLRAASAPTSSASTATSRRAALAGFIKGDLSTPAGVAAIVDAAAAALRCAVQCRRALGRAGRGADGGGQFLRPARAERSRGAAIRDGGAVVNVASIAGYGWRANLNRAKSMVAVEGFPDVAALVAEHR